MARYRNGKRILPLLLVAAVLSGAFAFGESRAAVGVTQGKATKAEETEAAGAEAAAGTETSAKEEKEMKDDAVRSALEGHDEAGKELKGLNAAAKERRTSYWGTGLTAEEEKELILSMDEGFRDAVVEEAVSREDLGWRYQNYELNGEDRLYIYSGNLLQAVWKAAEAGAVDKEKAELFILASSLYTDELSGKVLAEIREDLVRYLIETGDPYLGEYRDRMRPEADYMGAKAGAYMNAPAAMAGMPATTAAAMEMEVEEPSGMYVDVPPEEKREEEFNTAEYNVITENGFRSVKTSPLSTFSASADTAGYTKVKYDILQGRRIEKDEVKIEELINYFNFDYTADRTGDGPFIISTEYTACPWNRDHRILRIGIRADDRNDDPATNFVLVADVSGSMMSLNKLPLALDAYAKMVQGLTEKDCISLMYYADGNGVVLEGVTCDKKEEILRGLAKTLFAAGGGTNGSLGLNTAYNMAEKNLIPDGVNRVLIATDGDFNIGRTSAGDMSRLVKEGKEKGVYLTILGYGFENLKDSKMETMSKDGDGNYHFIGDTADAVKALVDDASCTLLPVADDVKIQVEFNPGTVEAYRLIGYENRLLNAEDFQNDKVDAGQIGAGKTVTVLYELIPADTKADVSVPQLKYSAFTTTGSSDICTVSIRYKEPNSELSGDASRLMEKAVNAADEKEIPDGNTALAISLAEYGMVLRESRFRGTATLGSAKLLAEAAAEVSGKEEIRDYAELIGTLIAQSE